MRRGASTTLTLTLGLVALVGAALVVRIDAGARQDQPAAFRAGADVVRVDVAVRRNGRPVSGLKAEDFAITDNGVPQDISEVRFEKGAIDVTIALDLSRSVSGDTLNRLRQGIDRLKGRLQREDRVRLVSFNMRVRRLVDFSEPRERTDDVLAAAGAGGATSLTDALAVLLASPAPPDRRHLIIVFSDGEDTTSITGDDTLIAVARRTTPTVAFVQPPVSAALQSGPTASRAAAPEITQSQYSSVVGIRAPIGPRPAVPPLYRLLATETGGRVLQTTVGELSEAFGRLLDDFRSSYVLFFSPRGVTREGFHELAVRVRGDSALEVRARRGYVPD